MTWVITDSCFTPQYCPDDQFILRGIFTAGFIESKFLLAEAGALPTGAGEFNCVFMGAVDELAWEIIGRVQNPNEMV